jgi:hypothetical protein
MDDLYDMFGENMFDSEEDVFDLEDVYKIPIEMVIHLKNRSEPIFAEHVFFFEKEDPVTSLTDLMSFTSTWWSALTEDKNINFIYLTDKGSNKKAILLDSIVAVSFVTPTKPEWMNDGQDNSDPS